MKSSIKKMSALLTMMAVAILTFTFTACSDDDDPVTEVTYTYGFSSMSASHPDFLEEMGKIENAFQSASVSPASSSPRKVR
jgi:PBP1b-binding outer membrane lipoprotein LpoB